MADDVIKLRPRRIRPCGQFDDSRSLEFCAACGMSRLLHRPVVPCSQCGGLFYAPTNGDPGYSHCADHGRVA